MGTYYLQTVFQLSMNLPQEAREPFRGMLDKFNTERVLWLQDACFVASSVLSGVMIGFNHHVEKSIHS